MILTDEERKLFWKNWLALLAFVNDTYKIDKKFSHPKNPVGVDTNAGHKISKKLFSNTKIIDKFIDENEIAGEDKELLLSWKRCIKSTFIVFRQLKKYCILYDEKNDKWYGVNGITSPIDETIREVSCVIRTVLIPFKNKIIYNSFIENCGITIGPNMRREFTEEYRKIKMENRIINKL
jgi:hypothetical protein